MDHEGRSQPGASLHGWTGTYLEVVCAAALLALSGAPHLLHVGLVIRRIRDQDHALRAIQIPTLRPKPSNVPDAPFVTLQLRWQLSVCKL